MGQESILVVATNGLKAEVITFPLVPGVLLIWNRSETVVPLGCGCMRKLDVPAD